PPAQEGVNIESILDAYKIDVDFSINTADEQVFQLYMEIAINNDKSLPGYSIYSQGVGLFDFSRFPKLTQKEKRDFLQFSGISICINQLRGIINLLTTHGPFGKYLLPAIDVNDLLKQKVKSLEKPVKSRTKKA